MALVRCVRGAVLGTGLGRVAYLAYLGIRAFRAVRPEQSPSASAQPVRTALSVSLTWHPEVPVRSRAPMDRVVCFPGR
jgi:hypothetical protein